MFSELITIIDSFFSLRVSYSNNDRISTKKHFRYVSLPVDSMSPLSLVSLGCLGPHLTHVLEHHVHVTIEGLHATQNLAVVAAVNQHQRVRLHCLRQK